MYCQDICEYYKTLFINAVRVLTPYNTFHISQRVTKFMAEFVSNDGQQRLVTIVGKNCPSRTVFQYEKSYTIVATNGYASITVAKPSYGAIISFVCFICGFITLLSLLVVWGTRRSQK